ncbi:hypothetical protein CSIM01_11862 [Colletotrichum simmondsii]|uniref:Uncharacterized protein n=1 Tax=Colletotrichum simmondsii TaxID=703756 RepID=A0A135TZ40_9PEZI|nr:hypothetical protein CSIM01_11862 [Colletotrichum simmondsii]
MLLSTKVATITLAVLHFRAAVSQRPVLWADSAPIVTAPSTRLLRLTGRSGPHFVEQSSSPMSATPFIVVQISTSREPSEQPGARILQQRLQPSTPLARLGRATDDIPIDVANDVYTQIYVTPEAAVKRLIDPEFIFSATQLKAGMSLGIDGREFITDTVEWDGKVTVHFDLHVVTSIFSDAVLLKVRPVLTHNHLQRVKTFITAGLQTPLYLFNQSSDVWAQDLIEPACARMSGPDGSLSIRIVLRSAQSIRTGGRQVIELLRGKGVDGF